MSDDTLTTHAGPQQASSGGRSAAFYVGLRSDEPTTDCSRHSLFGLDSIVVGRSETPRTARAGKELTIGQLDSRLSKVHFRLVRDRSRWFAIDAESKNGIAVNGEPTKRRALRDGDVVEAGRSFFLFRAAAPDGVEPVQKDVVATGFDSGIATLCPALEKTFTELSTLAPTDISVLIIGPTGVGKELAARAVHQHSGRQGPFVAVNCAAIASSLAESELFGHVSGAFSGASHDKQGHLRASSGGTLFLDELGELPLSLQATLLRAIQEREVTPVGSSTPESIELRIVSATNRELQHEVDAGRFRADLYARLCEAEIQLPLLAGRREDLGPLIGLFLPQGAGLTRDAARRLLFYPWPGNIRELKACLARAHALAGGDVITVDHLPETLRSFSMTRPAHNDADLELHNELVMLLSQHGGNVTAVAEAKGKARMQIHRWLKRLAIDPAQFRPIGDKAE